MTDLERENQLAQAIQAARNQLDEARAGGSVERQLEHATAAIVQFLDAQAIAVPRCAPTLAPGPRLARP